MSAPFLGGMQQPALTPAGTFTVYDPGSSSVCLRHASVTTDTAQTVRLIAGGQVIRSAILGPGGAAWDWPEGLNLGDLGLRGVIEVQTTVASQIEAQCDGTAGPP